MSDLPRKITVEEQRAMELRKPAPSNYVPALPTKAPTVQAYPVPKSPAPLSTIPVETHVEMRTSHMDRAMAWRKVMAPVAWLVGFSVLLIAYISGRVELLSVPAITVLVTTTAVVWVIGFLLYAFVSPDGAVFFSAIGNTFLGWRFMFREQRHRHELDWHDRGTDED